MNTNDSVTCALVKASDRQVVANRANAKQSTGPKSAVGKAIVARNSVAHGAYALCPVIQEVESERDWKRYRKAMLASLAPVGMLETTLAEKIIFNAWRLRRVARYELEQIQLTQGRATEVVTDQLRRNRELAAEKLRRQRMSVVEYVDGLLLDMLHEGEEGQWSYDGEVKDDEELSEQDAQELLLSAHKEIGLSDGFDDYWRMLSKPEAWTAGKVRDLAWALAVQHYTSDEEKAGERVASEFKQRVDEYRREHLLPDTETLEKVMRYESHLSRFFHRDLHEFQRVQMTRRGLQVVTPIAIDVDVASSS